MTFLFTILILLCDVFYFITNKDQTARGIILHLNPEHNSLKLFHSIHSAIKQFNYETLKLHNYHQTASSPQTQSQMFISIDIILYELMCRRGQIIAVCVRFIEFWTRWRRGGM
jgi:hypothetical protein